MNPRSTIILLTLSLGSAHAADFKKDVQPILKKYCYECHSEEADKRKAGYVFDDLHTLVNDIGPNGIVVPGNPAESHMIEVMTNGEGEKNHMPPDSKPQPSAGDIKKIENWIKEGAFLVNPATVKVQGIGPAPKKWRNKENKEIEASFVKVDGDNVVFKMPDGRLLPYPIANLTADSQIQVHKALLEASGEKPVASK
jgi:Planctomycete cytochrome C